MFFKLLFLFIVLPIVEIALLLHVGDLIGGWTTLALVIVTAIWGAHLVREQGLAALTDIKQQSAMGAIPAQSITEGIMILVAGVLLVTPGFITDGIGFLLTLPITRKPLAKAIMTQFKGRVVMGAQTSNGFYGRHSAPESDFRQPQFHSESNPNSNPHANPHSDPNAKVETDSQVIEGEWQRKD